MYGGIVDHCRVRRSHSGSRNEIQDTVKRAIEGMTGLEVTAVNVSILGIAFRTEERDEESKERVRERV